MAIFGNLELEETLQVNDKTRLNGSKSYISKDEAAVTLVRIKPEASGSYIQVSGTGLTAKDWYLDWQYSTAGAKVVSIEITTNGAAQEFTKNITVLLAADDMLWSSDQDLVQIEPDILKWVRPGRNSFLDMHRKSQQEILFWLDEQRIWDVDGNRFVKADLLDNLEVKKLSIYWTLQLIFFGLSNQPDDVFMAKAKIYESKCKEAKNRGRLLIDFDKDDVLDSDVDSYEMRSMRLVRR